MKSLRFEVAATLQYDFTPAMGQRFLGATGLGARGEVLALSTAAKPNYKQTSIANYQIHCARDGEIQTVQVAPGGGHFHYIQPWGESHFLLVHARGEGNNAFIVDEEGFCVEKFTLGDAIEDVQLAKDGAIWIAYFDEAIGNINGIDGLRCSNSQRTQLFNFNQAAWELKTIRADTICDCYMLNVVSNHDVWLCPYTGFPLHHLHDFALVETLAIPNEMAGSHAFAISCEKRLLFAGGYHHRNQIFWHELALQKTVELQILDEDFGPLRFERVQCRADKMWFWSGAKAYCVGVDEVWPDLT